MTKENDLVLIHLEDNPLVFARIENIQPDSKRGWFHVKLFMLQIPTQVVTWILRDVYINGEEFTMGGKKMRIEKVVCPETQEQTIDSEQNDNAPGKTKTAKVISISDAKKK
ncbi:MAG: hypothetical protein JRI53_07340 [Deltaproteobacteria bacterium]|nr:hypothetical protein [Deltaproteobacteria bacterium]MBW1846886.1 hypothetical protein [Deltaproteobacteria bacterium]MBW1984519.1 hypothetical protein [Deltaproteobacteria bacterium]MBW2181646.1 hypothetical protein [Deltaproteobacteria bacterium]